jgi:protoheme IX farnesyltransferase
VTAGTLLQSAVWRDFYELTKPKVVMLIVFTAIVGMVLAVPGWPGIQPMVIGSLGVGLAASSAAVINHVLDARIDLQMSRTHNRPVAQGRLSDVQALTFAFILCALSMLLLWFVINPLTALLTFASLIGYAVIYTVFLKRATPQNIVIGGAAGAAPPVLGWTTVTGEIHVDAIVLFLIIFMWTPPHFWALAIAKLEDYERVGIPMLPVTHGEEFTRQHILIYTVLLVLVTIVPYLTGMSGLIYLVTALILGGRFLYWAIRMRRDPDKEIPMQVFRFSIAYLMYLFAALLIDHYYNIRLPF